MPTHFQRHGEPPSLCDIPPQQWRNATLEVIDNVAALNAGEVSVNGFPYIRIRREDWDALLLLRGTSDEVLARQARREMEKDEADRRARKKARETA